MAKKQAQTQGYAKGVLIEQPEAQKHTQLAKGRPRKKAQMQGKPKEGLLSNQKRKNMHNYLKVTNEQERTQGNA